ncbi:MAG: glycoside hydrolase family 99-like domain-containing protein [Acetobacteraceae bacterium]|nr:glycoside hydrolase family 99-like domain-containing protein [Acetobacteraceae bacterium]
MAANPVARLFAFYLPQFHPIPENDRWWGPGFTEWTNVAKARPLFPGHVQPRLPRDLGFYDLRVHEVREAQADLARECGIEGFCYWHYWFGNGRRLLERPFNEVLESGKPDYPFSLAWANQSWTGIWHGSPNRVLVKQTYPGRADEIAHFNFARRAFEDHRYQRVDGKPVFVVFAPQDLPNTADFIDHWRELAHKSGLPGLYFVALSDRYDGTDRYNNPILAPFDAIAPHPPHDFLQDLPQHRAARWRRRFRERDFQRLGVQLPAHMRRPARYDFAKVVARAFHDLPDDPRFLPCVLPGWDNTPRSGTRGVVFEGVTPELVAAYLQKAVARVRNRPPEQRIVFLKAWNEWAEGNYLEPDHLHGIAYLEAVRRVMYPSPSGEAEAASRPLIEPSLLLRA